MLLLDYVAADGAVDVTRIDALLVGRDPDAEAEAAAAAEDKVTRDLERRLRVVVG